jgi:hypothetical protein
MVLMSLDARSVRAFFGTEHRRLPAFHDILRSPDRTGRIHRHDLAGDQPIEEHADRGQVPLDRRGHARMLLNAGGDHNRCNRSEVSNPSLLRPGEKGSSGPHIGHTGVLIANVRREKLQEASACLLAGLCHGRRQPVQADPVQWSR